VNTLLFLHDFSRPTHHDLGDAFQEVLYKIRHLCPRCYGQRKNKDKQGHRRVVQRQVLRGIGQGIQVKCPGCIVRRRVEDSKRVHRGLVQDVQRMCPCCQGELHS